VIAGGLVGALTGWGFSESEAREYEHRVERGDMLLAVEVRTTRMPTGPRRSCATTAAIESARARPIVRP